MPKNIFFNYTYHVVQVVKKISYTYIDLYTKHEQLEARLSLYISNVKYTSRFIAVYIVDFKTCLHAQTIQFKI